MLIGIVSDSHDHLENIGKAVKLFNERQVELVFHCGDWSAPFVPDFFRGLKAKLVSVFGNNERERAAFIENAKRSSLNIEFHDLSVEMEIENRKLAVFHGHSAPLLNSLILCGKYDAVFSGHTHSFLTESHGKTLHVNPGTISQYRDGHIIDEPTVALYDTATNTAQIVHLK
jgi:uncharacterized protein